MLLLLWWAAVKRVAIDKASPNTDVPLIVAHQHFLFSAWQTQLLRLAIRLWLRVWGAVVRHLPSILPYVTTERRWRPESSHTCIDRRHRPRLHSLTHIGGHGDRRWTNNADRRKLSQRRSFDVSQLSRLTTGRAVSFEAHDAERHGLSSRWLAKDLTSLHAAYYILHWWFVRSLARTRSRDIRLFPINHFNLDTHWCLPPAPRWSV